MLSRRDRRLAIALAALTACLTLIPYVVAGGIAPPGTRFAGFLLNPLDGFSYLAKMRQGMEGAWQFELPYGPDPGTPVPLFLFYLLLGHVQAWLHLPALTVFHSIRVACAFVMYLCALRLFEGVLESRRAVWAAYAMVLFGGGLGWVALPLGIAASDLTIPESVPFLTALVNPHFPLATAVLLLLMDIMGPEDMSARLRWFAAFACGMALGVLLPFVVVTAVAVPAVWLAVEGWRGRLIRPRSTWLRDRWVAWIGLCLGAGPWVVYGLWLTREHPVLRIWQAQNQTPSPSPLAYLIGYAVPILVILVGWRHARPERTVGGRMLLTWAIVTGVMLYVPGLMQRRLALGLAIPLAGLAGTCLTSWFGERRKWALAVVASLFVTIPSLVIVVAAGLSSVARGAAISVVDEGDVRAMEWAESHLPDKSLVLASPLTGNRLPALSGMRVLYGHSFETPHAAESEATVRHLLGWTGTSEDGLREARSLGVDYVFVGELENELANDVRWWESLPAIYTADDVSIFQVAEP
jgi:hypothetical protein